MTRCGKLDANLGKCWLVRTEDNSPKRMDGDYSVPKRSSSVSKQEHGRLSRAEGILGDGPVACPDELENARNSLDKIGEEETDDKGPDMTGQKMGKAEEPEVGREPRPVR